MATETTNDCGEFSVFQFFPGGEYERVAACVGAEKAMRTAVELTRSIGGRVLGTTERVIITDAGDFTVFEWKFGQGVVFPTR